MDQSIPQTMSSSCRTRRGHINRVAVNDLMQLQTYLKEKYADQVFEDSVEVLRQIREERMQALTGENL